MKGEFLNLADVVLHTNHRLFTVTNPIMQKHKSPPEPTIAMLLKNFPLIALLFHAAVWAQAGSGEPESMAAGRLLHVIATARDYDKRLPNFICTEITHRFEDATGTGSHWKEYDNYEAQITYFDRREDCHLLKIGGKQAAGNCQEIRGYRSEGLFGALSSWIFRPSAQTEFTFIRKETLGKREANVYRYYVPQQHSEWMASVDGKVASKGFHGLVWTDSESDCLVKIYAESDSETGIRKGANPETKIEVNYDFVAISSEQFLLPVKAEARTARGKHLLRNNFEFISFHRFGADANIKFQPENADPR